MPPTFNPATMGLPLTERPCHFVCFNLRKGTQRPDDFDASHDWRFAPEFWHITPAESQRQRAQSLVEQWNRWAPDTYRYELRDGPAPAQ
jgi:hypothetical protein